MSVENRLPLAPGSADPVTVVVPACNEATTVGHVIRAIRRAVPAAEVVVVDDGSTDETAAARACWSTLFFSSSPPRGRRARAGPSGQQG
jgi:hypothetical protein